MGIRRFTGARFCSAEHARADQDQMQRLMLAHLNEATNRLRESYRNPYRHRSIDDLKAIKLAIAS
jgi:hypothetical protein